MEQINLHYNSETEDIQYSKECDLKMHIPVQIPYDTGPIFAHTYHDAIGFADEQAGDLCSVSI